MIELEICIDVPSLAEAERFYTRAFGFTVAGRPFPHVLSLQAGSITIALLEKPEGSRPLRIEGQERSYARHWTPVHLDVKVDDLDAALQRAIAAGAVQESAVVFEESQSFVTCSDPFGHGFCLLGHRQPDVEPRRRARSPTSPPASFYILLTRKPQFLQAFNPDPG